MNDNKKKETTYILFTGLPGSGKSTTIRVLMKKMEERGETVIFRDEAVQEANRENLYISTFKYVPLSKLARILLFWLFYYPTKASGYKLFEYRFWNKKIALCKRMIVSHIFINKDQFDYFVDETIEAEFRILGDMDKRQAKKWLLYPRGKKFLINVNTSFDTAMDRAARREEEENKKGLTVRGSWSNKDWMTEMYSRISILGQYFKDYPEIGFCPIEINGADMVEENVEFIMERACLR